MMDDVAALRETIELQAEEIALLKRELGREIDAEFASRCWAVLRLTPLQTALLNALTSTRIASKSKLYDALYGDRPSADLPNEKIVDVHVCNLRRKLTIASGGAEFIQTSWGQGYKMSADAVERLRDLLGLTRAAA